MSPCDTPQSAAEFSPYAAEAAWRSVTPSIAGTPHVRTSRDGGRTYPAKHGRPLPAEPPADQPCTIPVYDPASATGRMLALDLDPARGDVDHQAADLGQLLDRLGVRYVADASPNGRHLYVPFAAPLPWLELRDLCRAVSIRFPAVDPAPMCSLGGQISPPGSRHKSGGWRTLTMPLSEARVAVERPNGPEVWAALLAEFAAELRQAETVVRAAGNGALAASEAELDDIGIPWVPRPGGRAPLGAELEHAARTGRWDQSHYPGRSEVRMAILVAAAARGWRLAEVQSAISSGAWRGLASLYERLSEPGRL